MAVAIDPQSAHILQSIKQTGQVNKDAINDYGNVLSAETVFLVTQCLNTTIEPLLQGDNQYDLIEEYLNKSLTNSQYQSIEGIYRIRQADFDIRYKECEDNPHRLLLWHGSGRGFWMSILSTGLFTPGQTIFTSKAVSNFSPQQGYGIFFADMAAKAIGYTTRDGTNPNILTMGLFDVCLGQQHAYFQGQVAAGGFASMLIDGQNKPNQAQHLFIARNLQIPIGDVVNKGGRMCEYIVQRPEQARLMYIVRLRVR
ncbi:MAG: hypothetical protein EZS28_038813 [Streblomastix strix]|uniref:Poly [ADP-ribose] polymerase n=1 Tax=Streblomastix strix TaxID=222440 RepID=A0A5J4U703_9EUKA|nr:MAG: hypothetical protein EZS28_038813 [Streblomastix strix]